MGELVISSGEELEVQIESEKTGEGKLGKQSKGETECETGDLGKKKKKKVSDGNGLSNGLVRWERLLPRMVLRVLLVEADDSTRQIIAALLRKCSYRVATVPDGLKAWEILKGRPHNIDLILTEVDLPSISGYALLTLIMEHDICKNIPVIMMSSQDSISTVYKCMLRGAADYLVKPIRKNELRNLWQHVWRRQSSLVGGNGLQDESVGQDKLEATSENNAASNRSSGEIARFQRNKELVEKGSDAQSSCTKPDLEAESAPGDNMQDILQPARRKFSLTNIKMQTHDAHVSSHQKLLTHQSEAGGSAMAASKDVNRTTLDKNVEPKNQRMDPNITHEACNNNYALVNSHREAIDFMGASANHNSCSTSAKSNFDSSPHLDLSLRRSHPSGFDIKVTEERHKLRHSDASAFTRYTNRPLHPPQSPLANIVNQRELEANSDRKISNNVNGYNSNALGPPPCIQRSIISMALGQTKESEIATSSSGQKVYPIQIPVKGIRFDNPSNGFGSVFPPIFCKRSGTSPMVSPTSASQPELSFKTNPFHLSNSESTSEQLDQLGQNANDCTNGTLQKQYHKLDSVEDQGHVSPAADQSTGSSFCNGAVSHLNSMGYGSTSGSNSNIDQVATVRVAAESKTEEGVFTQNSNPHRSIQREAALTKFRLKRKERCYEKKVRYESRKKLAEQRPRVKGQFVRQVQNDPAPTETD